jgi:hypothetical protein
VQGGKGKQIGNIEVVAMEPGTFYNVKKAVWHTILLSHDASTIIVENADTGMHNSEFATLNQADVDRLFSISQQLA